MKTTHKLIVTLIVLLVLGACRPQRGASTALPTRTPEQDASVERAVNWLVSTHQNDDGGYASFSAGANLAPSDVGGTLDAMLALAAAGHDVSAPTAGEPAAPLDYLESNIDAVIDAVGGDGGQAGKLLLALDAAGRDARSFGGHDFVAGLTSLPAADGRYGVDDPYKQSLAILGLVAAGEEPAAEAVAWLKQRQAASGSWDDGFGTSDSADATAVALMALLAAGEAKDSEAITRAVAFLRTARSDGGWAYGPELPASANSTALVIQALSALGEDWQSSAGGWNKDGITPLAALLGYQSESGAFQSDFGSGPFDDFFATVQAIPAAAGQPLPIISTAVAATP